MALTDPPVVKIGTTTLAASWSTTARIALGGLAITWGRTSHLEPAKAAQLRLEVLDTDGHLSSAAHLTGQPVTVTRADGRIIYRGRIDDYDVDHVHLIDPVSRARRRVWRLTLTAGCKIAELAQAVLPGDGDNPALVEQLGPNYWDFASPAGRLSALLALGADTLVAAISWSDPYPVADGQPLMKWRAFADQMTALEIIESVYQARPLGYALYRPHQNDLVCGVPTTTSGLRLEYTGGTLRVAFRDGVAGRIVPARTVAVPNGYRARTGINDAIDVVQVTTPRTDDSGKITVEHATSRPAGVGRREHHIDNDVYATVAQAANVHSFQWPFPLADVTDEFGPRPGIGDGFHDGIDFSGGMAIPGAMIGAAGPGKIVAPRTHPDYGYNVIIDHGLDLDGARLRTVYCHLAAPPPHAVGTQVTQGQVIGEIGDTGLAFGVHLHYETLVNGTAIDPRQFMKNKQYGDTPENVMTTEWQDRLAADTADLLDQLNGKLTLPTVRFDFRRFSYHSTIEDLAIETYVRGDRALYFPGSVFNVALDAAAAHQLLGGTLVYHDGWTHDLTLAPAISTAGAGLTVAQLCSSPVPTIAEFDPDITLADLGNISQGVPA